MSSKFIKTKGKPNVRVVKNEINMRGRLLATGKAHEVFEICSNWITLVINGIYESFNHNKVEIINPDDVISKKEKMQIEIMQRGFMDDETKEISVNYIQKQIEGIKVNKVINGWK